MRIPNIFTIIVQTQTIIMRTLGRRPQIPRKRPYPKRELCIETDEAGVTLAGELTLPNESDLHPGIVLLTGSGQHTRDEPVAGHPWFLVLSDYLTRNGFAVLRCDDRGVGQSTGDFDQATLVDYAKDAAKAIDYLRTQPNIDPNCCGFIGHSEGGMTGPLAATFTQADFIVLLAGPSFPLLPDTLMQQYSDVLKSDGKSEEEIATATRQVRECTQILREASTVEEAQSRFTQYLQQESMSKKEIKQNVNFWTRPWGLHHATYNPRPALEAYTGPILALFGGRDLQVHAESHAPEMQTILTHPQSLVKTFPDHNHLFQRSTTGTLMEYFSIHTTIDEPVLDTIADWLRALSRT